MDFGHYRAPDIRCTTDCSSIIAIIVSVLQSRQNGTVYYRAMVIIYHSTLVIANY